MTKRRAAEGLFETKCQSARKRQKSSKESVSTYDKKYRKNLAIIGQSAHYFPKTL